jgi:hypothetical protein
MLTLFAASIVRAMKARHRQGDDVFEKEARAALAIGRALRVTPQATVEPRTAARRRLEYDDGPKPWDRRPSDDIKDSDADAAETQCNDIDR